MTRIEGQILGPDGHPLWGYYVKVGSIPGPWNAISEASDGDGFVFVGLDDKPKAGHWYIYVIGPNNAQLSPLIEVETTDTDCRPGGSGVQTPQVVFKAVGEPPPRELVPRIPPDSYPFWVEYLWWEPSCEMTHVEGFVRDAHGNLLSGYTVKIMSIPGPWEAVSSLTGADGSYGFLLAPEPKAGRWFVFVVGAEDKQLSPTAEFETTLGGCEPGGNGIQKVHVEFRRRY